jgi:multidrug efflux pump
MSDIALKVPGIVDWLPSPACRSRLLRRPTRASCSSAWRLRQAHLARASKEAILGQVNGAIQQIQGARMFVVPPPPVDGLGIAGGFKLQVQDRSSQGEQALYGACGARAGPDLRQPKSSIGTPYSNYDINVPQLFADVDRVKAKQMGVPLQDIYDTLQINLGSLYVNDFTASARPTRSSCRPTRRSAPRPRHHQAQDPQRGRADGAAGLADDGQPTFGPTRVTRYNGFPSADINGAPSPASPAARPRRRSSACSNSLPRGMSYEWTDLTYQDRLTRDDLPGINVKIPTLAAVLFLSVVLVVLVLAAQYELEPAAGHHPDRADVHPVGAVRRVAVAPAAVRRAAT